MFKLHLYFKNCHGLKCISPVQVIFKSTAPQVEPSSTCEALPKETDELRFNNEKLSTNTYKAKVIPKPNLVATAFANLKSDLQVSVDKIVNKTALKNSKDLEIIIDKAKTVEDLLAIAEHPVITPKQALRIISTLGDWTTDKKISLSDFEKDSRFVNMCRTLANRGTVKRNDSNDLATVLGVTGDDEAAKQIASTSIPQKIKILSILAAQKRRSTPILRSLAFHITKSEEKLNIKQIADILYSISVLNFPDEVLLSKVCTDAAECIPTNTRSSIAGSITTSLGMMRYKDTNLLDLLCDWFIQHFSEVRVIDVVSLVMTLALLDYHPTNCERLFKTIAPLLQPNELQSPLSYVDLIWSLVLLNKAKPEQISTVLSTNFTNKITLNASLPIATKLKLLNIDGAAKYLIPNYNGHVLQEGNELGKMPLVRTKEKQGLVNDVIKTFSNLLPSESYLKTNFNTGHGFLIDGVCFVDQKGIPQPLEKLKENDKKIAVFIIDYQDTCKGTRYEINGITSFCSRLTEAMNYKVLHVPFTEYSPSLKLLTRVKYLENKLKSLGKS